MYPHSLLFLDSTSVCLQDMLLKTMIILHSFYVENIHLVEKRHYLFLHLLIVLGLPPGRHVKYLDIFQLLILDIWIVSSICC